MAEDRKYPLIRSKMGDNKSTWYEYPLFNNPGCPRARYVGGTSIYLCECPRPGQCPGVLATAKAFAEEAASDQD